MGFGVPAPPPQAAKAFVRQWWGLGRQRPVIVATLLDSDDSLEFVNEGGPAEGLACLALGANGMQELAIGSLGPGESKSASIEPPATGPFECVWACSDTRGRTHVGSYDGRHRRLKRREHLVLEDVFRELYDR
jgi:hypothetical protein